MDEIKRRIAQGEGQYLDFKFRIDDQVKIARTLAAFANSGGGSLLIGVKDNGKIAGCNPEEEYYMIEGAASMKCKPEVSFQSQIIQVDHYFILEIEVMKSDQRIKALDENSKWTPYYRFDDHSLRANAVLDHLWSLGKNEVRRPEKFSETEINLIRIVRDEGPISLSKLNKKSGIPFKDLSRLLALLVYWEIIQFELHEDGIRYVCPAEEE